MSEQIYWLLARGWQGFCKEPATWMQVIILGITAAVVICYTYQTRRLAESTEQLAGTAPLHHALWEQRLDCYSRLNGTLNLYGTALSNRSTAAVEVEKYGRELAREWSEALILLSNEEDPVYVCLDSDVKALVNKDTPTPDDIAGTMNSWRKAVRKSLRIPKVDGNIPDALKNARP